MKILNIIAQKPNSTGSGVFLTGIVNSFSKHNIEQAVICGIYKNDNVKFCNNNIKIYRVNFDTNKMPFHIVGMSDEMPYKSIKYSDFIVEREKYELWKNEFLKQIKKAIYEFKPDIIICHHLYLLTSIVVDFCKKNNVIVKIYGICHNTGLRQYQKTDFERNFIKENIHKLDKIFALSEEHKKKIIKLFDVPKNKIKKIGIGYDNNIFYFNKSIKSRKNKFIYVGKIAKKKGVLCLIKSFNMLSNDFELCLAGGYSNELEYNEIVNESKKENKKIKFLGQLSQKELMKKYNESEILILPSFNEGNPMVVLEALACGCKIIVSNISSIKNFYKYNNIDSNIIFVTLPKLCNVDDVLNIEIEKFENRIKNAILKSIKTDFNYDDFSKIKKLSWENIANDIIKNN